MARPQAGDIQEVILFLTRTVKGRDPIREITVRPIVAVVDCRKHRRLWGQLLVELGQEDEKTCWE